MRRCATRAIFQRDDGTIFQSRSLDRKPSHFLSIAPFCAGNTAKKQVFTAKNFKYASKF